MVSVRQRPTVNGYDARPVRAKDLTAVQSICDSTLAISWQAFTNVLISNGTRFVIRLRLRFLTLPIDVTDTGFVTLQRMTIFNTIPAAMPYNDTISNWDLVLGVWCLRCAAACKEVVCILYFG